MSERSWAKTAALEDVVYAAILRGLDGFPDSDTERPAFVLTRLHAVGAIPHKVLHGLDGIPVADLRSLAQRAFACRVDESAGLAERNQ